MYLIYTFRRSRPRGRNANGYLAAVHSHGTNRYCKTPGVAGSCGTGAVRRWRYVASFSVDEAIDVWDLMTGAWSEA